MRWVGKDLKWNLRNRSNFVPDQHLPSAFVVHSGIFHTQQYWLPDAECFPTHPEYFALIDGTRSTDKDSRKLCNSNPDVAKEIAKNMARDLREKPYINLLSLSPTDGRSHCWCECATCQALDQPDWNLLGSPVPGDCLYSRRQMVLYNNVATELEKEFPDQKIMVGAYANYTWPPADPALKAHHNLAVIICRYENYCYAHPVGDVTCEPNRRFLALIHAWQEQTPHIYFYEYYNKSAWLNFPWPITLGVRADIVMYKQLGVEGLYTQYSTGNIWTAFMPIYVASRLLWDHETDVDALMEEFYTKFYGEAAAPMIAYHECLENAMASGKYHHIGYARETAYQLFTEELVAEMKTHLQEAQTLASTDIVLRRLDRIAVMTEYTERLALYYRLMAEARGMAEGDAKTQTLLKAYQAGDPLRVDVRDNPEKYDGVVNASWLVNDISEGHTIRELREALIRAGAIPVFADSFTNGIVADSDSEPGFWISGNTTPQSTGAESGGAVTLTAKSTNTGTSASAAIYSSLDSRFNFLNSTGLTFSTTLDSSGMQAAAGDEGAVWSRLVISPVSGTTLGTNSIFLTQSAARNINLQARANSSNNISIVSFSPGKWMTSYSLSLDATNFFLTVVFDDNTTTNFSGANRLVQTQWTGGLEVALMAGKDPRSGLVSTDSTSVVSISDFSVISGM